MKDVRRTCVSSTIALFLMLLFLTGCPKRPEVAETAPKPIGPQGAIAMPAPAPPLPPTVSAVPPTVPAPEEKSPPEVTTLPGEAGVAAEAKVPEAETPPAPGEPSPEAQTTPEAGAAAEAQPTETEVMPGAETKGAAVKPEAEGKPGAQGKEAGMTPGTEGEVRGAEVSPAPGVTSPSAGEPSTEGVSPAPVEQVAPAPVPTPPSPPPAPPAVAEAAKAPELTVKDIYFDFDQALIRDDARKTLADNIQWFRANPAAKVTIEGHCDERGSSEYNLALGERRARVTRDSFVAAGIESNRISTISFGKERPFVLGHDETAWKWNRRAHFVLSTK
jgi:peptidoglycan-associated lipoprotein